MKRRTRRWAHILFNTLTAISLLLALATAGLWVRSMHYVSSLTWLEKSQNLDEPNRAVAYHTLCLSEGRLSYRVKGFNAELPAGFFNGPTFGDGSLEAAERLAEGGFIIATPPPLVDVSCPLLLPILALILLPSLRLSQWISARHRRRPGLCPACGYDTRANPEKCSECGREIATGG